MEKLILLAKSLQNKYPLLHFGGSFGLYLHGFDVGRKPNDLDICIPKDYLIGRHEPDVNSGFDFDYRIASNGIDIDVIVDSSQKFIKSNFQSFEFNVTVIETILQYKANYCEKGSVKHCEDLHKIKRQMKQWPDRWQSILQAGVFNL